MNGLDDVLDGFEAALALERELGVRVVPLDRTLLEPPRPSQPPPPVQTTQPTQPPPPIQTTRPHPLPEPSRPDVFDFVFLHDRPLSEKGVEMMRKIVNAMGKTAETAPIVVEPPLPPARAYVALGFYALKKFFPGLSGEPGVWLRTGDGKDVLVTYSPTFFERFKVVTEAVNVKKREMWASLKGLAQRFKGG